MCSSSEVLLDRLFLPSLASASSSSINTRELLQDDCKEEDEDDDKEEAHGISKSASQLATVFDFSGEGW